MFNFVKSHVVNGFTKGTQFCQNQLPCLSTGVLFESTLKSYFRLNSVYKKQTENHVKGTLMKNGPICFKMNLFRLTLLSNMNLEHIVIQADIINYFCHRNFILFRNIIRMKLVWKV